MPVSPALAVEGAVQVLTAPALAFVEDLTRRFRQKIDELLARRRATQVRFNVGGRPDFLAETADVGFQEARTLFEQVATSDELQEFLTLPAYEVLVKAR